MSMLERIRQEEHRVNSHCFACHKAKRRADWYCSRCGKAQQKAVRAAKRKKSLS